MKFRYKKPPSNWRKKSYKVDIRFEVCKMCGHTGVNHTHIEGTNKRGGCNVPLKEGGIGEKCPCQRLVIKT